MLFALQIILLLVEQSISSYTMLFITSSVFYLFFVSLIFKNDLSSKQIIITVIAFSFIKIFFLTTTPIGSDDYYRYVWDGKVSVSGLNPYQYAPNDTTLSLLHSDILPAKVSYPHIKTIYFPVAQWLFTLNYFVSGENVIALKFIYLLFELMILISVYFLLRKLDGDLKFILIYAALPLITFQFFIDAHIDLPGAALMIAAVALYFYNKKIPAYILLGLSLSVKPTGFLLVPILFFNEKDIRAKISAASIPLLIFLFTFLPYVFTASPIDTLINFSTHWTFNGMIYNFLKIFIADNLTVRIICGTLFIIAYLFILLKEKDIIPKIYLAIFCLMLFSPIAHPWYLVWFAVLLPIVRSYAGIYFVGAISLTSFTVLNFQSTGVWKEYSLVLLLQYLPLVPLIINEFTKRSINAPNKKFYS